MTKFEDLPDEMQSKGIRAVMEFLTDNGHANLEEAAKVLNCSPQMVWDKIMGAAGLPECEPPEFIEVGEPAYMTPKDAWDEIKWPRWVPVPEPGQSIEDDECMWKTLETATVSDVETFLAAEPDWTEKPDWCKPSTIMRLKFLVDYAKKTARPDHNFLRVLGLVTEH